MLQMNISEIKTHLSAALAKVEKGETVVICKRNKPIAKITPIQQKEMRKRPHHPDPGYVHPSISGQDIVVGCRRLISPKPS